MGPSITFEFIKEEDIYSIIPFLQLLDPKIPAKTLQSRLDAMIKQDYRCIGIYETQKLIGICGIWTLTKYYIGKHLEIDNIIILPEYHSQGIGSDLMLWIDDYAKENDCLATELNCYIHNEKAHKFWAQKGYNKIALHFQKKY